MQIVLEDPKTRTIEILTNLCTGIVNAFWCGRGLSSFFPLNSGLRQGCVLALTLFNTCMYWILDRTTIQSHCGPILGNIKVAILSVSGNLRATLDEFSRGKVPRARGFYGSTRKKKQSVQCVEIAQFHIPC